MTVNDLMSHRFYNFAGGWETTAETISRWQKNGIDQKLIDMWLIGLQQHLKGDNKHGN